MVHESLETTSEMLHKVETSSWTVSGVGYPHLNVLLLNCHQGTHLSDCCYWTVTRVHTFQTVVIELSPEYTPFNVLLLNCHQSTHLSACCYWSVKYYRPFNVLLLNWHRSTHLSACCCWTVTTVHTFQRTALTFCTRSVTDVGSTGPYHCRGMTAKAQLLHKYDP